MVEGTPLPRRRDAALGEGGEGPRREAGLKTMQGLPGLLPAATAARWLARLDTHTGGSLRLFDVLDLDDVRQTLAALPPAQLVASQCWVRRATPPHSWHQDGALNHDFMAATAGAPLPMTTCWITLTRCGEDAPSLAWLNRPLDGLLHPTELTDTVLRARWPAEAFEQAVLEPGDALCFDGLLLHRTHLTATMTRPRTSIELRFVPTGLRAPQLAAETLLRWP